MRLKEYLHHTRYKDETVYGRFKRFGKDIGVSMDCVRKWAYELRGINDRMKRRITEVTGGKVRITDMMRE